MTEAQNPLVIVGSGLAGYNLLKEYRKLDADREIVVITADDGRNYSKPMLSTGFTKSKTADELSMSSAQDMAEKMNATIRTMTEVTAIDADNNCLQLADETLAYSDLVLAWGAAVFRPPVEGDAQDAIYSVNDLMDYGRFREALDGKKRVLIIGAGLIGCEFANDLLNGGFEVDVVDPAGRALPTFLPEEVSPVVSNALTEKGANFHFGPFVKAVNYQSGTDGALNVLLSDDSIVEADIVVSAVGLRPRIALAEQAGLTVNKGICVDRELRTAKSNIYALGDCAEVSDLLMLYVLPLMAGARALAKTLFGDATAVSYGVMPVTIKLPACPTVVSLVPQGVEGEWQHEIDGANVKSLFYGADKQLRGYVLLGDCVKEKLALNKQLPAILA